MGAPVGNKYAAHKKPWAAALERALARYEDGTAPGGLNKIADKVVELAMSGDTFAIAEIGNRLDGKPHQSQDIALSGDLTIRPIDYSQTIPKQEGE